MPRRKAKLGFTAGPRAVSAAFAAILLAGSPEVYANDADEACTDPRTQEIMRRPVPAVVSEVLFNELIGWIALNTSYDLRLAYRSPPTLSFCDVGDSVAYEDTELIIDRILRAAFDYPHRHIYLVQPWSPVNLYDQSVLLHELIHDIQLSNRDWDCPLAPELEAYFLQDKWLVERGIFYPFNWAAIRQLSDCGPEAPWRQ
jgi:hypothetical protein